jgi:simple sugar transport system ATP-binding protein
MVRLEGLTKTWPDNGVTACDGVTLDIRDGEVLALLGENGAGKSTLVGLLAGTVRADAGQVVLDGRPLGPRDRPLDLGIALVPQHPPFSPDLPLWEHAILGDEGTAWVGRRARTTLVAELTATAAQWGFVLDWMQPCRRAGPLALQRATLTALFRRRPRVLILDEPTAALPGPEAEALLGAVSAWTKREGTAVVFITHKLPEALTWADRIAVMRDGRIEAVVNPSDTTEEALGSLLFPSNQVVPLDDDPLPQPADDAPVVFETRGTRADFTLKAGEVLGLTSLRGEGAEALEEELTGMSPLPEGCLHFDGTDVTGRDIGDLRRLGLSYVPSDRLGRGSSPLSPLASNVIPYRVGQLARRGLLRRRSVRNYFHDLKKRYGLAGEAGQRLVTLSGGNIQKLILAREMEHGPRVLILAEPSWGLDLEARRILYRLIREAARAGTAVVVLTSEPLELLEVCTRIGALAGGRLRALKSASEWTPESLGRVLLGLES